MNDSLQIDRADSNLPVSPAMNMKGDIASNWKFFKDQWQNYKITSGLAQKEANVRTAPPKSCWVMVATRFCRGYQTLESHTTVVAMLKLSFATHGILVTIRTDNGPQLVSEEFKEFVHEWKFNHIASSPYYAQRNSKAESAMKIAKPLLQKAKKDGGNIWLFIRMAKCSDTKIRLVVMSTLDV